ncbi:MAG: hypothetical protein F6K42_06055 [Leptolyngbya sp. SIO1D8]|nr:hypothetical protein [Leptolyngbya sp. SIO1D8]
MLQTSVLPLHSGYVGLAHNLFPIWNGVDVNLDAIGEVEKHFHRLTIAYSGLKVMPLRSLTTQPRMPGRKWLTAVQIQVVLSWCAFPG